MTGASFIKTINKLQLQQPQTLGLRIKGGKGKTNNSIVIMKGTSVLVMVWLALTIQEHWAIDRILKIVTRLTVAIKLAEGARVEVLQAYTRLATIIIKEGESTLVFNMQTKSKGIATEPAIIQTKEGLHIKRLNNINTMIKCLARLARGNQSQ